MKAKATLIFAAFALAGCGSGGGGLPVTPYDKPPLDFFVLPSGPQDYVTLTEEAVTIYEGLPSVAVTDLPDAGSARFDGVAVVIPYFTAGGYVGDFAADVSFSSQTYSGSASGFYYDPNEDDNVAGTGTPVSGTILLNETNFQTSFIEVSAAGFLDGQSVDGDGVILLLGRSGQGMMGIAGVVLGGVEDADLVILADK